MDSFRHHLSIIDGQQDRHPSAPASQLRNALNWLHQAQLTEEVHLQLDPTDCDLVDLHRQGQYVQLLGPHAVQLISRLWPRRCQHLPGSPAGTLAESIELDMLARALVRRRLDFARLAEAEGLVFTENLNPLDASGALALTENGSSISLGARQSHGERHFAYAPFSQRHLPATEGTSASWPTLRMGERVSISPLSCSQPWLIARDPFGRAHLDQLAARLPPPPPALGSLFAPYSHLPPFAQHAALRLLLDEVAPPPLPRSEQALLADAYQVQQVTQPQRRSLSPIDEEWTHLQSTTWQGILRRWKGQAEFKISSPSTPHWGPGWHQIDLGNQQVHTDQPLILRPHLHGPTGPPLVSGRLMSVAPYSGALGPKDHLARPQ